MPSDLTGYKNILLFGGSFDPPHLAHVSLPQQAAQRIEADLIAYIPAGRAPHKLDRKQTDAQHRVAMLRLALADKAGRVPTVVLTDEIDRDPDPEVPSYTVDTLEELHRRIDQGARLRLLIGADQLRIFDTWRDHERVISLAEPVVMVRPPDTAAALLESLPDEVRVDWEPRLIETDQVDLSSTTIRNSLSSNRPIDAMVCGAVADYIEAHGLYRDG